MTHLMLGCQ